MVTGCAFICATALASALNRLNMIYHCAKRDAPIVLYAWKMSYDGIGYVICCMEFSIL